MDAREELQALRRLAELEAKAGAQEQPAFEFTEQGPRRTKLGGAELRIPGPDDLSNAAYEGGGWLTDKAMNLGASPEVAAGVGTAGNAAISMLPNALAGAATIGRGIGNVGQSAGEKLMRMSLKPSTKLAPEKSAKAVRTMLTADVGNLMPGANVTSGGIEQLSSKAGRLGDEVSELLSPVSGTVNKHQIASDAMRQASTKYGPEVNAAPTSDLRSINRTIADYLRTRPDLSTPLAAHDLKQGIYKTLGDKAYQGEAMKSADVATQKAIAHALRMETEKLAPEIAPLNAEQSDLINAIKAAISRDATAGNKDPIGLGFLAGNPKAALGFMANRSELIKSVLARLLYSGSQPIGAGFGALAGGVLGLRQGQEP